MPSKLACVQSGGRHLTLATLILAILIADQTSKQFVRAHHPALHFGPLTMIYAENRGAFLSIGSNLPGGIRASLFDGVVAIGLIALSVALFRRGAAHPDDAPLALVIGGGAGNLIDRLRFAGRVTDFLYLHAGPLHTGVFNVADMAITAGALWLLVLWAFLGRLHRAA